MVSMANIPHRRILLFLIFSCVTCLVLLYRGTSEEVMPIDSPVRFDSDTTSNDQLKNGYYEPKTNSKEKTPRILLVSSLFLFAQSKHAHSDYESWLGHFLGNIKTDVYFFTSPDLTNLVQSARPSVSSSSSSNSSTDYTPSFRFWLNTTFSSPLTIPPLQNFTEAYTEQHEIDREKFRHSPELYAVWNAKAYFLAQAITNLELQGRTYDYVFWNDAGSFRNPHWFSVWPDPPRVEKVWNEGQRLSGTNKEDLVFFPLASLPSPSWSRWKEHNGPIDSDISEGSFFGGSPSAMRWWTRTFYTYHNYYLSRSLFIGKDQNLFNSLFFLFPKRFFVVYYGDVPSMDIDLWGACGWRWWYYHYWLGDKVGRENIREVWKSGLKQIELGMKKPAGWRRFLWWFWRRKITVPGVNNLAPVLPMNQVLKKQFGLVWSPPRRYVELDMSLPL